MSEGKTLYEPARYEAATASIVVGDYLFDLYSGKAQGTRAELLDADAFSAFQEAGIFDQKTAKAFRHMLQSGGTVDPMELYVGFRGKQPTIDALLRRDGIQK